MKIINYKRSACFSLITLVSLTCSLAKAENQRFVVIDRGVGIDAIQSELQKHSAQVERRLSYHKAIRATMGASIKSKIENKFGSGVEIELDGVVNASAGRPSKNVPPPVETIPWGITSVNATSAWAINKGAGAIVCVVDTGIETSHSDLAANIIGGENFVANRGIVDPAKYNDDNGHGTHVAGTIAAIDNEIGVVGVAPEASLLAIKVLDRRGSGSMSDVADGISSCVVKGAHVINMSLGSTSDSTLVREAVANASSAGVIIVVAAGNESGPVSYPAAYPEVFAVSAVDSSGALAYFSNTGPEVDFAAPGVSIYSTYKGNTYSTLNGTSMASPHVAGVAALMISSGSLGIIAFPLGLTIEQEGAGLPDSLETVNNL